MKIRKDFQSALPTNSVVNTQINSNTSAYSCNYINTLNTYSTTEHIVGIWSDGKNIYQKNIDLGTMGSSSSITVGTGYDTIVKFGGYIYHSNGTKASLNEQTSSLWRQIGYNTSSGTLTVNINRDSTSHWSDWGIYVTLEYTKTTD